MTCSKLKNRKALNTVYIVLTFLLLQVPVSLTGEVGTQGDAHGFMEEKASTLDGMGRKPPVTFILIILT